MPRENIGGGKVDDMYDSHYLFADEKESAGLRIVDTYIMDIDMCIGGVCKPSLVKKVVSKKEALSQCSVNLTKDFLRIPQIGVDSTSRAVWLVGNRKHGYRNAAALGSREAFEHYGVDIWQKGYQNRVPNRTRFAVLQKYRRKGGSTKAGY